MLENIDFIEEYFDDMFFKNIFNKIFLKSFKPFYKLSWEELTEIYDIVLNKSIKSYEVKKILCEKFFISSNYYNFIKDVYHVNLYKEYFLKKINNQFKIFSLEIFTKSELLKFYLYCNSHLIEIDENFSEDYTIKKWLNSQNIVNDKIIVESLKIYYFNKNIFNIFENIFISFEYVSKNILKDMFDYKNNILRGYILQSKYLEYEYKIDFCCNFLKSIEYYEYLLEKFKTKELLYNYKSQIADKIVNLDLDLENFILKEIIEIYNKNKFINYNMSTNETFVINSKTYNILSGDGEFLGNHFFNLQNNQLPNNNYVFKKKEIYDIMLKNNSNF